MDKRWILVAVGAVLLGAAVMGTSRDTEPRPQAPAPPVPPQAALPAGEEADAVPAPAPVAAPGAPAEVELTDEMLAAEAARLPPARRIDGPDSPIDPDQVFTGDLRGVVAAAVSRQERFVDCFDRVRLRDPEDQGYSRFTLEITLTRDGTADARVITGPDDPETQTCVGEAMGDARFEPPAEQQVVTWGVPLPEPVAEPDDEGAETVDEDEIADP